MSLSVSEVSTPVSRAYKFSVPYIIQGVQRSGKPGNVREFRFMEKKSGNFFKIMKVMEKSGILILFCENHFQPI